MIVVLLAAAAAQAASAPAKADPLKCETDPVERELAATKWLVYACEDRQSGVVVSKEENPAAPLVFILTPKPDGTYDVYGEGNGDRRYTAAARDGIVALGNEGIKAMIDGAAASR